MKCIDILFFAMYIQISVCVCEREVGAQDVVCTYVNRANTLFGDPSTNAPIHGSVSVDRACVCLLLYRERRGLEHTSFVNHYIPYLQYCVVCVCLRLTCSHCMQDVGLLYTHFPL